jgi:hypothetical protein
MNLDYYKNKLRNALYEYATVGVDPEVSDDMTEEEPVESNKKENNINDLTHVHPGGQSPLRNGVPRLAAPTKSLTSPHMFLEPKPIQKLK